MYRLIPESVFYSISALNFVLILLVALASAQPQINRFFDLGSEWKGSFPSGARRLVGSVHDFQHRAAVLTGDKRLFIFADTLNEMLQFLGIALIECLLENRERPAFGRAGLLHRIPVAPFAVRKCRVAHEQIGINHARVSIHLHAVIHATVLGPAVLRHAKRSTLKFNDTK